MINANMLKGKMAEAGITQRILAEKVGFSENTLTRKISGKRDFTTSEAVKICEILGITDNAVKVQIFLA